MKKTSIQSMKRDQLLKKIKECATTVMTITEVAKYIGLENGQQLRDLLDGDIEVRNLWEQTRKSYIETVKELLQNLILLNQKLVVLDQEFEKLYSQIQFINDDGLKKILNRRVQSIIDCKNDLFSCYQLIS